MSGAVKGITKTFRRAFGGAGKILPVVLAGAAIAFTAGAALGLTPTLGGAVAAGLNSVGITAGSTLSNVLTGVATQSAYGSLLGGATAGLTGGDIMKGAQYGAAAGAVTGGVSGYAGGFSAADPLASSFPGAPSWVPPQAPGLGGPPLVGTQTAATLPGGSPGDFIDQPSVPTAAGWGTAPTTAQSVTTDPDRWSQMTGMTPRGPGLGGVKPPPPVDAPKPEQTFLDKLVNSQAGAAGVMGIGSGLTNWAAAGDREAAADKLYSRRLSNYQGPTRGLITAEQATSAAMQPMARGLGASPAVSPAQFMVASTQQQSGPGDVEFRWNPQTQQVERVQRVTVA